MNIFSPQSVKHHSFLAFLLLFRHDLYKIDEITKAFDKKNLLHGFQVTHSQISKRNENFRRSAVCPYETPPINISLIFHLLEVNKDNQRCGG